MKALLGAQLALLLSSIPLAQQISSVDLTHPPEPSKHAENQEKRALPNGCEKLSDGAIADGWVKPENDRPRDIVVEVVNIRDKKPAIASEVEAEVRLRNADNRSIQIPWSTDPTIIKTGQNEYDFVWDVGTFEFMLRDQHDNEVFLRSLTGSLYGSKFAAGSQLTIQPGESIAAVVKFKLENEFRIPPERLKEGEWQLLARWHQIARSWHVKDCGAWNGFFQYAEYYRQQNPAVTIQVTRDGSLRSAEAHR
jgi:hypothetical protein